MTANSKIEWTDSTWNPTRGCSRVSPGCEHCYAERMAHRLSGPGRPYEGLTRLTPGGPRWTGELRIVEDLVEAPLRWRRPRRVFVNSMSDLFHEHMPVDEIARIFRVMERASWHTFQILTKRSQRLRALAPMLPWPANVWIGVSIEAPKELRRADDLRTVPSAIRFLSLEPLLEPLPSIKLTGIDWVIVGGESGPAARPMHPDWVRDLRDRCVDEAVAFFFKQWGGPNKKASGRLLDGRTWDDQPSRPHKRRLSLGARRRALGPFVRNE